VVTDPPAGLADGAHVRIAADKPADTADKP
jgi:hypothetical protein